MFLTLNGIMYLKDGKSCMHPEAGEWLKQAEYDLETAETILNGR